MMTEEEKYGSSAPSAESPRSSSSKTPPSAPSAPSASSAPPAEEGGRDGDQRQKTPQHKPGSPSTSQQPVGALAISTTPESAAAAGSSHRKPTLLSRFYTAIQTALLSPSDLEEELESATEKLERRASSSGSSSPSLSIERRNSAPAGRSSLSASFLGGVSSGGGKGEEGGAEADVVGSSGGDLLVLLPNSLSDLEARYKNSNTHGTTTTPAIISTTSMSLDGHQIQPADTNDPPSHKMELLELLPNDVTEEDEAFFPNTLGDFFWELLGFSEESLAAAAAADGVSSSSGGDVNDTIIELTGTKSLSPQRQQHQQPSEDHHHQYDLLEEEPSRMSLFLERPPVKLISAATEGFSRSQIREEESDEEDGDDGGGIQRQKHLLDRLIMKQDICKQLISHLPPLLQEAASWRQIYSLDDHGASLQTLYNRTCEQGPLLVVFRDQDSEGSSIFGCFCSDGALDVSRSGYGGNGSCFLWKWDSTHSKIEAFHATGENDYFVLSQPHCLAFGGGDGKFGLWVDADLLNGHSGPCETFNNPILSNQQAKSENNTKFEIQAMEIWKFEF